MGLIDLAGHTALITGAAKRVGRSIARALADQGVDIIIHYNTSRAEAEDLVSELRDRGIKSWAIKASLADRDQVEAMWKKALSCAPRGTISFLVNNASIFPSDTSCPSWDSRCGGAGPGVDLSAPISATSEGGRANRRAESAFPLMS